MAEEGARSGSEPLEGAVGAPEPAGDAPAPEGGGFDVGLLILLLAVVVLVVVQNVWLRRRAEREADREDDPAA